MTRIMNSFIGLVGKNLSKKWLLGSVAAVALAAPNVAQAHDRYEDRGRHVEVDIRVGDRHPVYEERQVRVWVPPVYRTVCDQVWVEPVYRTVCDRQYIAPVYQTVCEKVWVPEVCQTREVRYYDHGRVCTRIERVVVTPGHFESRDRQVLVAEGHWQNVERQELVAAGHFDKVERQEVVAEGHYEFRTERVAVSDRRSPVEVINPMLGGLGIRVGR